MRPIQSLPLGCLYVFGKIFTWVLRDVIRYRRSEVIINLSRSFPEKKYHEINKILKGFYTHLGHIFAETLWFGGCRNSPEKLHNQHLCELSNFDEMLKVYNNSNSLMVLTSHYGNWEIMGGIFQYVYTDFQKDCSIKPEDICVVYRKLRNSFWDEFFKNNRIALFEKTTGYIESMNILRYAVENKSVKKMYIFPTDQYPYGKAARCVIPKFMNQKTYAMIGGASLANKFGMAVMYMSIDKKSKGHYIMTFKHICDNASEMSADDIMKKYYQLLEEEINNNPQTYLWSHKRWK